MKKLASGALLGLTLLLFVLWWSFLRAPGPMEVCDHILEVTLREAEAQAMNSDSQAQLVESTRAQCIEHKRDKL